MEDITSTTMPWFHELFGQVEVALRELTADKHDRRPALKLELEEISDKIRGWSESLAKSHLPSAVRERLEADWGAAAERQHEIEAILSEQKAVDQQAAEILRPELVLERVERLAEVLASNNPIQGNLELSLHIDRIECFPGGKVLLRTCKLGTLTEAVELLTSDTTVTTGVTNSPTKTARTRRRARLRVIDTDESPLDIRALADFVADTDRFAGLGEEWFWVDEVQIPDAPLSWVAQNAAAVFERRQASKLSFAKLAEEFAVTSPTIAAAIRHFEETHPGVHDGVSLRAGSKRGPRVDVTPFAVEARALWDGGMSKESLAEKYGYSPPIIDKALDYAYKLTGEAMPTRSSKRNSKVVEARRLLDDGKSLDEIAEAMKVSDVTARGYLHASFAADGEPMPDLRSRRKASDA